MAVLVLAGDLREANAYGQSKGIRVRFATGPEVIQAASEIVELPSFRKRRDRFTMQHALQSRLRYGKGVEYVFEDDWLWVRPPMVDAAPPQPMESDQDRAVRLLAAAEQAIEAVAGDLGMTSEEFLKYLATDARQEPLQVEQLPLDEPEIVVTAVPDDTPEPEVAKQVREAFNPPEPEAPKPAARKAPVKKAAAKKAAPRKKAAPAPVVDAPVEF